MKLSKSIRLLLTLEENNMKTFEWLKNLSSFNSQLLVMNKNFLFDPYIKFFALNSF